MTDHVHGRTSIASAVHAKRNRLAAISVIDHHSALTRTRQVFPEGSITLGYYLTMIDLAAIRRGTGLTQMQMAVNLGVGQAQISKVERQDDMLLSTLASYLKALGATASLVIEFGQQTVTYDLTAIGKGER